MDEIRATGKTVDDALTEALIQLGTTSDQVQYEVIEKGSAGFLGIGSKPAVILVKRKSVINKTAEKKVEAEKKSVLYDNKTIKSEKKSALQDEKVVKPEKKAPVKEENKKTMDKKTMEAPAVDEVVEKSVKVPVNAKEIETKVDAFLKDVFKAMEMEVEIKYEYEEASRTLSVELVGQDMGILIGKRGQTMDSLQYLISLVANKESSEYVRVKLDTENYRKRRRATLENLAKNIAYKVKRERKPVTLEPMNPYERRIIHSALQNDRYVETHSEGNEPYRRVVVTLKKNNQ